MNSNPRIEKHPGRWVRRVVLAGGLAAATVGTSAGVAVSASHASCTPANACQGGSGSGETPNSHAGTNPHTTTTPHGPGSTGGAHGQDGQSTGEPHADPSVGILPLSAQAAPILDRRVTLDGVSGTVLVKAPTGSGFISLQQGASVPVGSVVDATNGVVTLTSVKDAQGTTQRGSFWGGVFKVEQTQGAHPVTVLLLVSNLGVCRTSNGRVMVSAAGRRVSRLWGHDNHGRFVTRGHYGVASVRGTVWLTQDTCTGTLFRVTRGTIVVRDFRRHRKVTLTAGKSYLVAR